MRKIIAKIREVAIIQREVQMVHNGVKGVTDTVAALPISLFEFFEERFNLYLAPYSTIS
ncbi:MAG: hypothetical protein SRB2_00535 [Desulfobacteraceae bacterium Eth-SRB2]|nr:MAG: hypothetical protein SRB2_00535 [Desulfobacteraceae bacterium Eth-SRB2]